MTCQGRVMKYIMYNQTNIGRTTHDYTIETIVHQHISQVNPTQVAGAINLNGSPRLSKKYKYCEINCFNFTSELSYHVPSNW